MLSLLQLLNEGKKGFEAIVGQSGCKNLFSLFGAECDTRVWQLSLVKRR